MKLGKIARSYFMQAEVRVKDAKDAVKEGNHAYAVRLSQESVELSLKATLKLIGIDYPKVHDVSDLLSDYQKRLPSWFRRQLAFLKESSKILVGKREIAFYGSEDGLKSPDELLDEKDSKDAYERAVKIYKFCTRLLNTYEAKGE